MITVVLVLKLLAAGIGALTAFSTALVGMTDYPRVVAWGTALERWGGNALLFLDKWFALSKFRNSPGTWSFWGFPSAPPGMVGVKLPSGETPTNPDVKLPLALVAVLLLGQAACGASGALVVQRGMTGVALALADAPENTNTAHAACTALGPQRLLADHKLVEAEAARVACLNMAAKAREVAMTVRAELGKWAPLVDRLTAGEKSVDGKDAAAVMAAVAELGARLGAAIGAMYLTQGVN